MFLYIIIDIILLNITYYISITFFLIETVKNYK